MVYTWILTIVIVTVLVLAYLIGPKIIETVEDFLDQKDFIKYCQKIVAKEYTSIKTSIKIQYSYSLSEFLWSVSHVSDKMINRKFLLGCGTKEDIVSIKRIWCKAYGQYLVEKRNALDKESIKNVLKYCNLTKEDLMYLDQIYSEMDEETYQFFKKNEKKYKVRD